MPKVGKKHYDYSPKGIAMAKNAAKKKGLKVKYSKGGEIMSGNANRRRSQFKRK